MLRSSGQTKRSKKQSTAKHAQHDTPKSGSSKPLVGQAPKTTLKNRTAS